MSFKEKLTKFLNDAKRVMIVAKKPSKEEFVETFKVTGIGIILIGVIGLVTFLVFHFLIG